MEGPGSFSHKIVSNCLHGSKVKQAYPMLLWERQFILASSIKAHICRGDGISQGTIQEETTQRTSPGQVFNSNPACGIILSDNS